jgi:hypothetical protein
MIHNQQRIDIAQLIIPIIIDLYGWGKSQFQKLMKPGLYEVLNYDSTLEILDSLGKEAVFTKSEEVRFLRNNVIAFQDQVWGDGKILLDYQCSPGIPVDFYRFGHKTHVLISLREVMKKGERKKFNIRWRINDGFLTSDGYWGTCVNHSTQSIKTSVIFPKDRPPARVVCVEESKKRIIELPKYSISQLSDKRWTATWVKQNPRINEQYLLKWNW